MTRIAVAVFIPDGEDIPAVADELAYRALHHKATEDGGHPGPVSCSDKGAADTSTSGIIRTWSCDVQPCRFCVEQRELAQTLVEYVKEEAQTTA